MHSRVPAVGFRKQLVFDDIGHRSSGQGQKQGNYVAGDGHQKKTQEGSCRGKRLMARQVRIMRPLAKPPSAGERP